MPRDPFCAACQIDCAGGLTTRNRVGYRVVMQANHPLQVYREAKGLTAVDLAAHLGVTRNTIWRWENRRRAIDSKLWMKIHEVTGIPVETLATAQIELPAKQ